MIAFASGLVALALGYLIWGRLAERSVAPDPSAVTPAVARADGLDFVAMPTWRIWLVQLLNIAGLGPVFGSIMGALWGPQVFLWVVFGSILGGAVHDLLAGAMSMRSGGAGLPDLIGSTLGRGSRHVATVFIVVLMILVGTVFVKGPALLLVQLVPAEALEGAIGGTAVAALQSTWAGASVWLWLVMVAIYLYYVVATLLPIHTVIGRVYPLFAAALLVMVAGLGWALLTGGIPLPVPTLANLHPGGLPAWPVIFITVSCGAVSGFHGTQCPLMARCMKSERSMRGVFYGAMVAEGVIALVWAASAQGFYGGSPGLGSALAAGGPGQIVHEVCTHVMGAVGGALAVLGVVVLPITSGDTAFRVARLIVADYAGLPQARVGNRYLVAAPLFAVSLALNFVNFSVIWRYFGWANQTLAAVTLWAGAVWLARRGRWWWLAAAPATFMSVVTTTYILVERVGLGLPSGVGVPLGLALGLVPAVLFLLARPRLARAGARELAGAAPTDAERETDTLAC